jgi:putative hydrolase of the HAD superfamily
MYKHLFFDLDETLWDYFSNSSTVLTRLFHEYELQSVGVPSLEAFLQAFKVGNNKAWHLYDIGELNKETLRINRFPMIFAELELPRTIVPEQIEADFMSQCPKEGRLMDGALELLESLHNHYTLHIITNGFNDTQKIKMESANIAHFFHTVTTSESTGARKPEEGIYRHALSLSGAPNYESLMVGDKIENDVLAAERVGIHGVFYNPHKVPFNEKIRFEISHLSEVLPILNTKKNPKS